MSLFAGTTALVYALGADFKGFHLYWHCICTVLPYYDDRACFLRIVLHWTIFTEDCIACFPIAMSLQQE